MIEIEITDSAASNRVRVGENMPCTAHLPASRVQALSLRVHGYVSWRFSAAGPPPVDRSVTGPAPSTVGASYTDRRTDRPADAPASDGVRHTS
jgi:hypothetical protein